MREILFRGKREYDNEWVYGHLVIESNKQQPIIVSTLTFDDYEDDEVDEQNIRDFYYYYVIPETVGQYTGLCDKNGRKIFEGDIVLTQDYYDKPYSKNRKSKKHIGIVEYKIGSSSRFFNKETGKWDAHKEWEAEWIVKVKHYGKFRHCIWGDFFDCEIIGNLYDNPELMEVKQNG